MLVIDFYLPDWFPDPTEALAELIESLEGLGREECLEPRRPVRVGAPSDVLEGQLDHGIDTIRRHPAAEEVVIPKRRDAVREEGINVGLQRGRPDVRIADQLD